MLRGKKRRRMMDLGHETKVFVAGRRGMVGEAVWRCLEGRVKLVGPSSVELDLTRQEAVEQWFMRERPDYVVVAAAKVGGIMANVTYPAQFLYVNLVIVANVIYAAWRVGVKRLLFLGSSCIYPRDCPQPIREEYLLTGPLEKTNEAYAVAKIAGLKLCEFYHKEYGAPFWAVMPTNIYGMHDNFDLETSHVLPAMLRKFHLARLALAGDVAGIAADAACFGPIPAAIAAELDPARRQAQVVLWGTGSPRRDFLHVDDLALACVHVLELKNREPELLNIGRGDDMTISEAAELVQRVVGYDGPVVWDRNKPDGTPRKLLDISRMTGLGWQPKIKLEEGLRQTYVWYLGQLNLFRVRRCARLSL
ncbi:GDP-L-fucose synthase [Desulfovibrionales bacterium]